MVWTCICTFSLWPLLSVSFLFTCFLSDLLQIYALQATVLVHFLDFMWFFFLSCSPGLNMEPVLVERVNLLWAVSLTKARITLDNSDDAFSRETRRNKSFECERDLAGVVLSMMTSPTAGGEITYVKMTY